MNFDFKFKFGRERMKFKDWVKMSVLVNLGLDIIAIIPGVDRELAFNIIDEINLKYGKQNFLNDYVISDPELLSYRVDRELTKALNRYRRNS